MRFRLRHHSSQLGKLNSVLDFLFLLLLSCQKGQNQACVLPDFRNDLICLKCRNLFIEIWIWSNSKLLKPAIVNIGSTNKQLLSTDVALLQMTGFQKRACFNLGESEFWCTLLFGTLLRLDRCQFWEINFGVDSSLSTKYWILSHHYFKSTATGSLKYWENFVVKGVNLVGFDVVTYSLLGQFIFGDGLAKTTTKSLVIALSFLKM